MKKEEPLGWFGRLALVSLMGQLKGLAELTRPVFATRAIRGVEIVD